MPERISKPRRNVWNEWPEAEPERAVAEIEAELREARDPKPEPKRRKPLGYNVFKRLVARLDPRQKTALAIAILGASAAGAVVLHVMGLRFSLSNAITRWAADWLMGLACGAIMLPMAAGITAMGVGGAMIIDAGRQEAQDDASRPAAPGR